jgi:2-desacetyl-2-hydroxyethyl bacteriochlorophyllide A dehydrogenase
VKTEKAIPEIRQNEVLVKVISTGICGTDHGIYKGYRAVSEGLVAGHEFIGEVARVGVGVDGYEVGDRVIPSIVIRCGQCEACLNGYECQCEKLLEIGIHVDGSFAEYVAVPVQALHKVDKHFPSDKGASVEPVAVALSAVKKVDGGLLGKKVIINGAGAIGLYIAQIALIGGAASVVVLARSSVDRLELSASYGAKTINRSKDDLDTKLAEYFGDGKAHVFFEASGVASTVNEFIPHMKPHGQIVLVGVYKDQGELNLTQILRAELRICGSFCYLLCEFDEAIKLVEDGKINFDRIVSHYDMAALPEAMEDALSRKVIKAILL